MVLILILPTYPPHSIPNFYNNTVTSIALIMTIHNRSRRELRRITRVNFIKPMHTITVTLELELLTCAQASWVASADGLVACHTQHGIPKTFSRCSHGSNSTFPPHR